jgi:hypothetical protein
MLYLRRQSGDANPWTKESENMTTRLQRIADGMADLTTAAGDDDPCAITEPSKTYNSTGRLML